MELDPVPIDPEPPDHGAPGRRYGPHPICPYLSPHQVLSTAEEVAYLAEKALVRADLVAHSNGPQDPEAFRHFVAPAAQHRLGTADSRATR